MSPVSIEQLLEHRLWVRRLARGLVLDESRVDDLEQETWLRAMRRPPEARGIRTWLRRVVRNLAIDQGRRDRTHRRACQRRRAGGWNDLPPGARGRAIEPGHDPFYGALFFSIVGAAELLRAHDLHAERERAGTAEPAS